MPDASFVGVEPAFSVVAGAARSWTLTVYGGDDGPLAGLDPGASVSASCWPGGDLPTLFAPTVAWLSAPLATLTLSVSAVQSALLEPGGRYPVNLTIGDRTYPVGRLEALAGPGAGTAARVYGSLAGLLAECSWLASVEGIAASRALNFAPELDGASRWLEQQAVSRQRRDAEKLRKAWGLDADASQTAFLASLDAGGLATDHPADRGLTARLCCLYALYLALDDQVGNAPGSETPLQALAMRYRARASIGLNGWYARVISTDPDRDDYVLGA